MLYSFGFRFSFSEFKILRAGGLVVSSVPATGTKIYINGKLAKETSLLSRSLFLQGLTPHTYTVHIEKEGYFTWSKTLPVFPERVTETRALLVRQNPDNNTIVLKGDYKSISFENKENNIITLTDSRKKKYYYSIQESALVPLPKNVATSTVTLPETVQEFLTEKKITDSTYYDVSGERITWWDNNKIWIHWLRGEEFLPIYTEKPEALLFDDVYPVRQVFFYPGQEAILAAYSNQISVIELDGRDRRNIYPLYKGREPQFVVSDNEKKIYILDDGNLIVLPLS